MLLFTVAAAEQSEALGGNPADNRSFEGLLEEGIEALYETDWGNAREVFDELKSMNPSDPRPYFFESMIPFWEYFFIDQRSELANDFLKRSEDAVELSRKQLNNSPSDTTLVLLLSGLYGYRSLVAAGEKKYTTAMRSGLTGFSYTRQLLSLDSDRPDAQIGRGMFYYMVGSVPREARWVVNAAGLRADIEMGFAELRKAAESDNPVSTDAKMMLMYLKEKENQYDEALIYAQKLTLKHPKNVIFHFKEGEILEKLGKKDESVDAFKKVLHLDNSHLPHVNKLAERRIELLANLMLN